MLFLNERGLTALNQGEFDAVSPDTGMLSKGGETPAAIYHWLVAATGRAAAGIAFVTSFLRHPQFGHVDYFTTAATPDGERFVKRLGFEIIDESRGLYRYRRLANRPQRFN